MRPSRQLATWSAGLAARADVRLVGCGGCLAVRDARGQAISQSSPPLQIVVRLGPASKILVLVVARDGQLTLPDGAESMVATYRQCQQNRAAGGRGDRQRIAAVPMTVLRVLSRWPRQKPAS
jgi:hypothetical protein